MMPIVLIAMTGYMIILQKRIWKVNREREKEKSNREVLLETGKKLLEAQTVLLEKEEKSERDVLLEIEIAKYIKDYLLKALRDGNFNEWGWRAAHGYVVQEYPEIFKVFKEGNEEV